MKSNTTPAFTMVALYVKTQDDFWKTHLDTWIASVQKHMTFEDGVHGHYRPGHRSGVATLVDGFIFIDVLCDAYVHVTQDPCHLEQAKAIAEACLKWQWDIGVIPMSPTADRDHLDGQVDFSISLRRVAELTKAPDLKRTSHDLMQNAWDLHKTDEGMCTHIGRNGRPIVLPSNTVDPKYNGLALKGVIHLDTMAQDIYKTPVLMDLFKDR